MHVPLSHNLKHQILNNVSRDANQLVQKAYSDWMALTQDVALGTRLYRTMYPPEVTDALADANRVLGPKVGPWTGITHTLQLEVRHTVYAAPAGLDTYDLDYDTKGDLQACADALIWNSLPRAPIPRSQSTFVMKFHEYEAEMPQADHELILERLKTYTRARFNRGVLRAQVWKAMRDCASLKQLLEIWPQGRSFVPESALGRLATKTTRRSKPEVDPELVKNVNTAAVINRILSTK